MVFRSWWIAASRNWDDMTWLDEGLVSAEKNGIFFVNINWFDGVRGRETECCCLFKYQALLSAVDV